MFQTPFLYARVHVFMFACVWADLWVAMHVCFVHAREGCWRIILNHSSTLFFQAGSLC